MNLTELILTTACSTATTIILITIILRKWLKPVMKMIKLAYSIMGTKSGDTRRLKMVKGKLNKNMPNLIPGINTALKKLDLEPTDLLLLLGDPMFGPMLMRIIQFIGTSFFDEEGKFKLKLPGKIKLPFDGKGGVMT